MTTLNSAAEIKADVATNLPNFPINLREIKRSVAEILTQFGRNGIFQEYTTHDISHIDDMLATIEWLIPAQTREILTPAEWLMIVLSIYFHDMGLVVTEEEYQSRASSGFSRFCEEKLFSTPGGTDYRAKVDLLEEDKKERFLYQEFVRYNHGRRVRAWVEGNGGAELGHARAQITEIDRLLSPLDSDFRKDLALVCESHNLDDIDDFQKYRLSHPYGNSDDETVNIHYCAAVLRTVDLIQITQRRAPSVLYRIINPQDPISQAEWAKQNAVKRVRQKVALDRDGNATSDIPSDTIEVFATFTEENGFFGLTSYLKYAEQQIVATYNSVQKSKKNVARPYEFHWKYVDESNIQVDGFVKKPFGFEIDQGKILDLLTGHTLYNDSTVVIRELAQNAIDAVRLQYSRGQKSSEDAGFVRIIWRSESSELTVIDNGTGMTQEIVENHLLKVGSSRYQDPKFKEANPTFSPISRFGIGVLSAFMVADNVEIVTVSPEEQKARKISLRSVHGKYLMKLLDKDADPIAKSLGAHGTSFKLKFRPSASGIDVVQSVRDYIFFPKCKVSVTIDDNDPIIIGYRSPKFALEEYLENSPVFRGLSTSDTRVIERTVDGLTIAYALRYNKHYRDWRFISISIPGRHRDDRRPPVATCVEGIAVHGELPGYRNTEILAVANAFGKNSPKTNVARSSIESTSEHKNTVANTYKVLFEAVVAETKRLNTEEGYSITWAAEEIPYLISPALPNRGPLQYPDVYRQALSQVPMFLVEVDQKRSERALSDLIEIGSFWTVDSLLTRSVEQFIREARAEVAASDLLVVSQGTASPLPKGAILANGHNADLVRQTLLNEFEVGHIVGRIEDRRLDLRWDTRSSRWLSRDALRARVFASSSSERYSALEFLQDRSRQNGVSSMFAPIGEVTSEGLSQYVAVRSHAGLFILADTPIARLFSDYRDDDEESAIRVLMHMEALSSVGEATTEVGAGLVDRFFKQVEGRVPASWLSGADELASALSETAGNLRIFNPLSWRHREPGH